MNRIFPVYKPKGITSYDVIRELKKKYPGEKIGHGGTLDPLAEGVLVIGVGKEATRKLHEVLKGTDKEYEAVIELGKVSETDDGEGPISQYSVSSMQYVVSNIPNTEYRILNILKTFVGEIQQVPPKYSAVKVKGLPAYKRARRGEKFILEPKTVMIHDIKLLSYEYPILKIKVTCASGVYIRSLARDIGEKLGMGAYLKGLVRTRVGEFTLSLQTEI